MTDTGQQNRPETSGTEFTGDTSRKNVGAKRGGEHGTRGGTTIADDVVEKIAGMAARDVVGVHALGSGMSRAFGAARERVPGTTKSVSRGVKVEVSANPRRLSIWRSLSTMASRSRMWRVPCGRA